MKKINLRLLEGYVAILLEEKVSYGSIILPDVAKKKLMYGKVVAVGKGSQLLVGEEVVCKEFTGSHVEIDQQEYKIFKEEYVLAKVIR